MRILPLLAFTVAVSLCIASSGAAQAQTPSGVQTLPGNANAIMIVDVARLLESPLAKQLGWQSKLIKGYADRPLPVPATAKKVTVAAVLHPGEMTAVWQAAIIELSGPPNFEPILRKQGGYLDQIAGKKAAWTPQDVFFVELGQNSMGVVRPGQRQYVTRWLTGKGQTNPSAYLKQAQVDTKDADVLFALDLDEVVGATSIRYASRMGQLPSLAKLADESPALLTALASVKGLRLALKVTDKIEGKLVIEFEQPVAALGDAAKPFVMDVLTAVDLYEPTMDSWQFKADGKTIVATGIAQAEVVNNLLMLLSPGNLATDADAESTTAAAATTGAAPKPTPADPKLDAAAASQQYYKAISTVLSGLSAKASPTDSGKWLVAKARSIEQLPILNVDPELVSWGNMVVEGINRAAVELAMGQQKAQIAAKGVQSPTAYVTASEYGESNTDSPESRAAFRNAEEQRRQVSQAERAAAADRALAIINQILATRGKIRADMVQKYGVEF